MTAISLSLSRREINSLAAKFPFCENSTEPAYLIIQKKCYNVRDFIKEHPGGPVIASKIGEDVSDVFEAFHSKDTYELLANFYAGDVADPVFESEKNKDDFSQRIRDIKQDFLKKGYFQSKKSFFGLHFLINVNLLGLSLILLFMSHQVVSLCGSAFFMALFWQQCGWLSHDILHHSVFQNRRLNTFLGYVLGGVCQGFSVQWWKFKHNTHHSDPNVHGYDPDINTLPFLAWSNHALNSLDTFSHFLISNQSWLYVPIIFLARISWVIQSLLFAINIQGEIVDKIFEQTALGLHWCGFLFLLSYLPIFKAVMYFFLAQAFGGLLLATVFSLNHNGMLVLSKQEEVSKDFFSMQVLTGRDIYPSWFMNWFCGGLNFQIEHHLFPTMPRHSYPHIQPLIRELCSEFNLPHHTTGFFEGTKEVFSRLHEVSMSSEKKKSS